MIKKIFIPAVLLLIFAACAEQEQTISEDVIWLIDALELKQGSVVADIGSGNGRQAIEIAGVIGPVGKVFATEVGEETLETLRYNIERRDILNITVLEGDPAKTNLPELCCDAIYMRRVYHHVARPDSMNISIYESLRPGGRLAILDFEPSGTEGEPGNRSEGDSHGITTDTLIHELTNAGFEQTREVQFDGRYYRVLFRKPAAVE